MEFLKGWLPPSRENWELIVRLWQFFPVATAVQHLTDFYPQGKTSIPSRWNLPGKYAWCLMECPGFLTVLYTLYTLPPKLNISHSSLPVGNYTMAGMYTVHYLYRAIAAPLLLNPSMSPIHPIVFVSAAGWQVMNGLSLGGWLAGYGPTSVQDWSGRAYWAQVGIVIWLVGLMGNIFHDDELREIRRRALRKREREEKASGQTDTRSGEDKVQKVYEVPQNGLFRFVLYPHFFCEWIEWAGFWMVGGLGCVPAQSFLLNELSTMLPRALAGKRWYIEKFGEDKIGSRKAAIPGII